MSDKDPSFFRPSYPAEALPSDGRSGHNESFSPEESSDWDYLRDRITLPDRSAGATAVVLVAFGLAMLSATVTLLVFVCGIAGFFTCGATWFLAYWLTLHGFPVHLASLAAGIVAGGCRRDGARAAFTAVLFGALGTALSGLGLAALWKMHL